MNVTVYVVPAMPVSPRPEKVAVPSNAVAVTDPMSAPPVPLMVAVTVASLPGPLAIGLPPASRSVTVGWEVNAAPEAAAPGLQLSMVVAAGAPSATR